MANTDSILILQYNFSTLKENFISEQSCLRTLSCEIFGHVQ